MKLPVGKSITITAVRGGSGIGTLLALGLAAFAVIGALGAVVAKLDAIDEAISPWVGPTLDVAAGLALTWVVIRPLVAIALDITWPWERRGISDFTARVDRALARKATAIVAAEAALADEPAELEPVAETDETDELAERRRLREAS